MKGSRINDIIHCRNDLIQYVNDMFQPMNAMKHDVHDMIRVNHVMNQDIHDMINFNRVMKHDINDMIGVINAMNHDVNDMIHVIRDMNHDMNAFIHDILRRMNDPVMRMLDVSQKMHELRGRLEQLDAERAGIQQEIAACLMEQMASVAGGQDVPPPGNTLSTRVLWALGRQPDRALAPVDIARMINFQGRRELTNIRGLLSRMARDGRARRVAHGRYMAIG